MAQTGREATSMADHIVETVQQSMEDVKGYLASPEGRRMRAWLATGLIVAAPAIARLPWMRLTRLGRLIALTGGAALVVKMAELIRDWEPGLGDVARRPVKA